MRIAILGTRGIPAAYGGFETLAWELSTRLAQRGHEVTVYCLTGRTDELAPVPVGISRRFLPYLPGKYLETVTHTGLSILDATLRKYDAIWLGNAANAIFAGLPRLRGTVVALNVDGIERQRAKWGLAGRLWYSLGERLALVFPNVVGEPEEGEDLVEARGHRGAAGDRPQLVAEAVVVDGHGLAAGTVVLVDDGDPESAVGEQGGGGHPPIAGAHDDYVEIAHVIPFSSRPFDPERCAEGHRNGPSTEPTVRNYCYDRVARPVQVNISAPAMHRPSQSDGATNAGRWA